MRIDGNTILVTGGSSGIGKALAHRLHDMGNHLVIAGRRKSEIDKAIAGRERMSGLELDVADPASIASFAARVTSEHPALNVLINNAGIMKFEDVSAKRDLGDAEATIATNLLGPIRLTDALIGHLVQQPAATIINLSSGLAFVPLTAAPTYSATKAAIHFYTVSLREALAGKVEVLELVPPGVQTELTPGQSNRQGYMPLEDFIEEVLAILARQPTPPEILVEQVALLRFAERENRFDATLKKVNEMAEKARRSSS